MLKGCDQVDAAVMPNVRRLRGAPAASRTRLQSRQFPAHAGDARTDQRLVAVEPEGEADQDRRQGHQPWPHHRLPDGRGRHSAANVLRDFAADCRAAADAAARAGMRRPMVMRSRAPDGRTTPRCHRKPDSSDAVTSLPGRMESDRPSTGTRLLSSAENRYHPNQVQRSSGESRLNFLNRIQKFRSKRRISDQTKLGHYRP